MNKVIVIGGLGALALLIFSKVKDLENKIVSHITGFALRKPDRGAFWFSVKVAFDNHTSISIPLESLFIKINYVKGNGERQEVATSKPTSDRYVLKANSRTELDDILVAVPFTNVFSSLKLLLQSTGTNGTRQFEVMATAKAAGQTVTKTEIFNR
jgi:hypothetical protein